MSDLMSEMCIHISDAADSGFQASVDKWFTGRVLNERCSCGRQQPVANSVPTKVRDDARRVVRFHADYAQRGAPIRLAIFDDRLEVANPGLLPFGLTLEDLPRGISGLRNRVIGRTFHAL